MYTMSSQAVRFSPPSARFQGAHRVTNQDRDRWTNMFESGNAEAVFKEVKKVTGIQLHWGSDYRKDSLLLLATIGLITELYRNPNAPRLHGAKHIFLGQACGVADYAWIFQPGRIDVQDLIDQRVPKGIEVLVLAPQAGLATTFRLDDPYLQFLTSGDPSKARLAGL